MNRDITLGILLGYKTILQIVAFVLTFSIQKVKLKGLNDAKYIAVAVYITNFVTAIAFVTFYLLKRFRNLYAALFSLSTLFGTTAILALIFIPKVFLIISLVMQPIKKIHKLSMYFIKETILYQSIP